MPEVTRRQAVLGAVGTAAGLAAMAAGSGLGGEKRSSTATSDQAGTAKPGRMPTAFVPHGGGPWPILRLPMLPDDEADALQAYMRSISAVAPRPRALLVVSAHWEATRPTVNTGPAPGMLFDYYNFPPEAYQFQWPAPGDPELASQVRDLLADAGFDPSEDAERGFDHGTFIPLMLAYPQGDVPVVQLSLLNSLDPEAHVAMGRALAPLRDEGVYILGSGNSFHNLRALFRDRSTEMVAASDAFDDWLAETVQLVGGEREERLARWAEAPSARPSHPREEHLIPLMVAAGAAGTDPGQVEWSGRMAGFRVSAHHFGQ